MKNIQEFINLISPWSEVLGFIISIFTAFKVFFINNKVNIINNKHLFLVIYNKYIEDFKKISETFSQGTYQQRELISAINLCINDVYRIKKTIKVKELRELSVFLIECENIVKKKKRFMLKSESKDKIEISEIQADLGVFNKLCHFHLFGFQSKEIILK